MHEHIFVPTADVQQNYPGEWGSEDERIADAVTKLGALALWLPKCHPCRLSAMMVLVENTAGGADGRAPGLGGAADLRA